MRIEPRQLPDTLPFLGDLPPLLTRLYAARGVQSEAELDKSLARLIPFQQLKGIDAAVDLLVTALEQRQRILIVGDFDADGATASTVGMLGLRLLGAAHVDYLVPNRFEYGYGLTPEIVEVALAREPQLLITVDNGISSVEGVAAAKAAGLQVLVTDHHLPGLELPAADAIVNPNQPGCEFPEQGLGRCRRHFLCADGPAGASAQPGVVCQHTSAEHRRIARPGGPGQRGRRGAPGRE